MSASKAVKADPERPPVMGTYKPDWLEKPTGDDMQWAYPAHAQRRNIEGKAVITCQVAQDGRPADCRVVSESPQGEDFGVAAIALSQKFRMLPPPNGSLKPTEVTIPVMFKMPEDSWPERMIATAARPKHAQPPFAPLDSGDILLIIGLAAIAFTLLTLLFSIVGGRGRRRGNL